MNLSPQDLDSTIGLVKEKFKGCKTPHEMFEVILALGEELPSYPEEKKTIDYLVKGCQSQMFLHATQSDGHFFFTVFSDALISKGLAALLYLVYQGKPLEVIIKSPPHFLKEWGLLSSLSPSRSKGVMSLYLKMQQEAIKLLTTYHAQSGQL